MPTSCIFSTDLHSMGQFPWDGSRIMFETYVDAGTPDIFIEELRATDGLVPGQPEHGVPVNRQGLWHHLPSIDGAVPWA